MRSDVKMTKNAHLPSSMYTDIKTESESITYGMKKIKMTKYIKGK